MTSVSWTARSFHSRPWVSPSNVTVPIITATQPDRPRRRVEPRQPAQRRPQADDAVARLDRRHAREEVVVDGERLAVAASSVSTPHTTCAASVSTRVAERRGDQPRRVLAPARGELDPGEDQQPRRGGPAPEPLRVRPQAARRQQAADRPPRAERAEDVAEQHAREHEPDPERDQDERGREVVERGPAAQEAGQHDHDEQRDAEQPAQPVDGARAQQRAPMPRQRAPGQLALHPRLGPQRRQRDEGEHEHRARRPREQLRRDRQVAALDEPVGGGGGGEGERRRATAPEASGEPTARRIGSERSLDRPFERPQAEGALEARGDLAVLVDHEQPRLRSAARTAAAAGAGPCWGCCRRRPPDG